MSSDLPISINDVLKRPLLKALEWLQVKMGYKEVFVEFMFWKLIILTR
ncbi:hypothetical protein V3595_20465 [Bacillus sp. CFBP9009]